jgi:hypothetical protein
MAVGAEREDRAGKIHRMAHGWGAGSNAKVARGKTKVDDQEFSAPSDGRKSNRCGDIGHNYARYLSSKHRRPCSGRELAKRGRMFH